MGPESHKLSRRTDLLAATVLGCLYIALTTGHFQSIDGMIMFQEARSLLYNGSLRFADPINWGSPIFVSKYGLGLTLLYLPGLALFSWLEPYVHRPVGDSDFGRLYLDPVYAVAGIPVQVAATAATAYFVARFCRRVEVGQGASLISLALFGAASPALVYARADYAQPLEGLCWISSLYFAVCFQESGRTKDCVCTALALFYAILTRPLEGLIVLPAISGLIMHSKHGVLHGKRRCTAGMLVLASAVAAAAITIIVNYLRYGGWLETGYESEGWTNPLWLGVSGFLFSPSRGLLWSFPAVILVPFGFYKLWSIKRHDVAIALGSSIAVLVGVMSMWWAWWGGVNWGPRLILPAMPLLAVVCGVGISVISQRRQPLVVGALAVAGLSWALPCIFVDIHAGYGGATDGTLVSFPAQAHPGIGGWGYITHWFSYGVGDSSGVDIIWFRLARVTYGLSLVPFVGSILMGLGFLRKIKICNNKQASRNPAAAA